METTDKLKTLLARCKCGIYLKINEHRDFHKSVEQLLVEFEEDGERIDADIRAKMVEADTIIDLHFYPDTPMGSYRIFHYDVDAALTRALNILAPSADP